MSEGAGPRLIERAVDVLLALSDGPKSFTAVRESVGLSKATVHRILTGLAYRDFVVHDRSTSEYMLGPGSYRMARTLSTSNGGIAPLVRSVLESLSTETQETVILHVRVGGRRVCVDECESPQALRYTAGVGTSAPLYVGSAGKALSAWMAEEQMRRLLPAELDPLTEATIVDWDVLLEELRTVRSQGWAESHGERVRGAFAVSAPIFDERGEVVAAVSILGPEARLTRTRLIEFRRALLSAATRASSLVSASVPEASNTVLKPHDDGVPHSVA